MLSVRNATPGREDFALREFLALAAGYGHDRFGYVVTPNVDQLMRYYEDPLFRARYRDAECMIMDGKFAACLVRLMKGQRLPVCSGSDLTRLLLEKVARPADRMVMIGGNALQGQRIRSKYGFANFRHYDPPPGFTGNPEALEECLQLIEGASPFRFCFLALESPQQEMIAQSLRDRGRARGLALCVGASVQLPAATSRSRLVFPDATIRCEGTVKPTSA